MSTEVRNDVQSSQDAYRQKLEETRDDQERELNRIKEKNNEDAAKERSHGTAAVNHIREETRQRVETLRNEGENRIGNERGTYDRRLKETQRQKEQELGALHHNLDTAEENTRAKIAQTETQSRAEISRQQQATQAFEQREEQRRAEMLRQNRNDLDKSRQSLETEKNKLADNNSNQVRKMNNEHVRVVDALRAEHQEALERQTSQDDARLHAERDHTAKQLDQEHNQFAQREAQAQEKGKTALSQEADNSQRRLNTLKHQDQQSFNNERVRGAKSVEKTRAYYADTENRLHKEGDEQVANQKQLNDQQLRMQDQDFRVARDERNKQFEADRKKAFDNYHAQMQHDDVTYRKSLSQQKNEFDRIYTKNADMNESILENSKDKLETELIRQKEKSMQNLGKYADKSDDPFYQIKIVEYHLKESPGMYELKAQIPEKEKDSVKVIVKDNKVILQGQKHFEDRVSNEHHSFATESSQSYREEIPLSHPVMERYISSDWQNGVLTLKIPKA